MKRAWQLALVVLLLGALALALFLMLPGHRRISTTYVHGDGPYSVPDGGTPGKIRVMADGKLAVTLTNWREGAKHNFYVFDPVALSFTGYRFIPPGYPWLDGVNDMVADSESTYIACSYVGAVHGAPELCIFDLASGDLVFTADVNYIYPEIFLSAGSHRRTELAVGVDPHEARVFFLNLTKPGLIAEITLPSDYRITSEWTEWTDDYHNEWPWRTYFHFSNSTSTLFVPLPHLELIYWCQIQYDLGSGFYHQDGTIPCGVDPTFITAPPSGSPLYILDDKANKIFVLDPATRTITKHLSYESGTRVRRIIEHEGCLFLTTYIKTASRHDPKRGTLIKIDPASEQQWSVDFVGSSPGVLSAYQGKIYVVRRRGSNPIMVEYDANIFTQLSETFISSDAWSMEVIPQIGKGVIRDIDARALYVVDLQSLGKD